jgi:hypothetical protein
MESDPISAFHQRTQPLTDAILKAASAVMLPAGAVIPDSLLVLGGNPAQDRVRVWNELKKVGYVAGPNEQGTFKDLAHVDRINLVIRTANRVAHGLIHFLTDQTDIDEYPAC